MRLETSFEVPAPVDHVWSYLLDVPNLVPCMPGASLNEIIDETTWAGEVTIRLGAISMSFAGTVRLERADDAARTIVLRADGSEQRGKGSASATITSTLAQRNDTTQVSVVQELEIAGQAAQFGRGVMQDVAQRLTEQFADCLVANIQAGEQVAVAKPLEGLSLGAAVLRGRLAALIAPVLGPLRGAIKAYLETAASVLDRMTDGRR